MNIKKFKENWGSAEIPTEIEKLIYFQENISQFEYYSECFGVRIEPRSWYNSWSEDPCFLNQIYPFAQANGSGSSYAIWHDGTNKPMNEMPIIVFGDEGGVHIIAQNIVQLLHLLTFDCEISVNWDDAYFYKDEEEHEENDDWAEFAKWIQGDFGLDAITNSEQTAEIISQAQEKYKACFDLWFGQYYKSE